MLQASRDVCFRCFGEEASSSTCDHQRITPGHERILQSDDTLQKFYKEWAEYVMLQSRTKRRLEDHNKFASLTDSGPDSKTVDTDSSDKQLFQEARKKRREQRAKRKLSQAQNREEHELDDDDHQEEVEEEKFKMCIQVLRRMGREEDMAEVMRIEQRLGKLREQRRLRRARNVSKTSPGDSHQQMDTTSSLLESEQGRTASPSNTTATTQQPDKTFTSGKKAKTKKDDRQQIHPKKERQSTRRAEEKQGDQTTKQDGVVVLTVCQLVMMLVAVSAGVSVSLVIFLFMLAAP